MVHPNPSEEMISVKKSSETEGVTSCYPVAASAGMIPARAMCNLDDVKYSLQQHQPGFEDDGANDLMLWALLLD
jgi:hypothetical protein